MAITKEILNSHPVGTLKKEIAKTNVKGYSKMKKAEIVDLMMKHKEKFGHIQKADGKKVVLKPPKELKESTKPDKPKMTKEERDKRIAEIAENQKKRKAKKEEPKKEESKKISAPKWTEKVPSDVYVIKDTKNNSIRPGFVNINKAYEGMIDPEKYGRASFFTELNLGNVSHLRETIKKNNERPEAEGSEIERMDVREKNRGMEKMIKDIQGGRFKFEKKKVEKTKTGIKIDGKKLNQNDWRNGHYSRADEKVSGDDTMGSYFIKPVDLKK